jgi:polysaccharide deacetylase family protein (PEP-CTERM system associated)
MGPEPLMNKRGPGAMLNALTFDVEEYFHAEVFSNVVRQEDWTLLPSRVGESTRRLLDLLDAHGVAATFFVLGWVADRDPGLVREIRDRGHEVACHGFAHRLIYAMKPAVFQADVRRAKRTVEDAIGAPILGYRAPTFSVVDGTRWALDVLAEEGFRYDSSIFPIRHDRYGIPNAPRFPHRIGESLGSGLVEFPITTLAVGRLRLPFSGGGYFRLLPYPAIRAALQGVNRWERMPGMVYLHPWEVDPEQPRLPVRGLSRLRHYLNLGGTEQKLERLLRDFEFAPAGRVLQACGFAEVRA